MAKHGALVESEIPGVLEQCRKEEPGMYIGSTGLKVPSHLVAVVRQQYSE